MQQRELVSSLLPSPLSPEKTCARHTIDISDPDLPRCGCGSLQCKAPLGKHYNPQRNSQEGQPYGIRTGRASGIIVIDTDNQEADELFRNLGPFAPTLTVRTKRGRHYYYQAPGHTVKNSVGRTSADGRVVGLGPKIDIKGEGGIIAGPGSDWYNTETQEHGTYTIECALPVTPLPAWLANHRCLRERGTEESDIVEDYKPLTELNQIGRAMSLFRKQCQALPEAISGQSGQQALWAVCMAGRDRHLPREKIVEAITEIYNPRCVPPWSPEEIQRKVDEAISKGYKITRGIAGVSIDEWESKKNEMGTRYKKVRAKEVEEDALEELTPKRKTERDPSHTYEFLPQFMQAAVDPRKATDLEIVNLLSSSEHWEGVFSWDQFKGALVCIDPPIALDCEQDGIPFSDHDASQINLYLEHHGLRTVMLSKIQNLVEIVGKIHSFHPVKDYLDTLPMVSPVEAERYLDTCADAWFEPLGDEEWKTHTIYLKKFVIGAIQRIYNPGCEMHNLLILHGPQGIGKSSWTKKLFTPWFRELTSIQGRDACMALEGMWGIEIAEMEALLRAEKSTIKEFLSRATDQYRQFGGAGKQVKPRTCVFAGNTNETESLDDATGSRRMWPVVVKTGICDVDRDKVWSCALALSKAGYNYWLSYEENQVLEQLKKPFYRVDPWHEAIEKFVADKTSTTVRDVYSKAVMADTANFVDLSKFGRREEMRVADTLKRLGFVKRHTRIGSVWER